MKLTVYVRPVDEAFLDLVAAKGDLRVSGWAYRALLEAAIKDAKAAGISVPPAVVEQLARIRAGLGLGDAPKRHGRSHPRSKKDT